MEKERKITAPDGCEIEKVELIDGEAVITFREKERQLPKSWTEFCGLFQIKDPEVVISEDSRIYNAKTVKSCESRRVVSDRNLLPDSATAEAVLALCQLIQLRNCYNGDWVPNWNESTPKYTIDIYCCEFDTRICLKISTSLLYFKSEELRDEFLRNFRPLIEKLKPLYGIKEGGEE